MLIPIGCVDKDKYKKELAGIDSMTVGLRKIDSASRNFDSMKVFVPVGRIDHDLQHIDTLLPDTLMDKELAVLLMDYRSVIRPLKQYGPRLVKLGADAQDAMKRLKDLGTDLTNQSADEKQVPMFMETERKNILNMEASFDLLNKLLNENIKKADSLDPLIKGRIKELEIMQTQKKK